MKVLFNHSLPFALAHGGMQTHIQQTQAALQSIGLEVEPLRWWDDAQTGHLIHYFGIAPLEHIQFAQAKSIPVVMTNLLAVTCNRSDFRLRMQGWLVRAMLKLPFGEGSKRQLAWHSFGACAHNIVGLEAERRVLELVYAVPPERVSAVPLGLSEVFLKAQPGNRSGDYLVTVGTLREQKNCIPLARLAHRAQVPVLFVGKPYSENDPYWSEFLKFVDGKWVRHQPHVADPAALIALLQRARGSVVMSQYENWCLVAHEAAACGLPLLLPPLKWARERFGDQACYFTGNLNRDAAVLREFYERCPSLPAPRIQLYSWTEVAARLKTVYERVLSTFR